MNKSESITNLVKALTTFQGKMTAVKKDATNPFYKSKYATLDTIWETIRKPLSENGLSVAQTMNLIDGKSVLETTLYHTSGEWISGTQLVNPVKDDPQSLGSAISYARRYSLSAILGIVADEDDDANIATKPEPKLVVKTEAKAEPRPKPETTAPPPAKETKITDAQTKKIYASVKGMGIEVPTIKNYLKEVFKKISTKELTISEASRLIEDIEAGKLNQEVKEEGHLVKAAKAMGAIEVKGE
jgi:hypothetical protein